MSIYRHSPLLLSLSSCGLFHGNTLIFLYFTDKRPVLRQTPPMVHELLIVKSGIALIINLYPKTVKRSGSNPVRRL
jgi:hypothetical protein